MSHRKTDLGIPCRSKSAKVVLGRVDGFDQDEAKSKCDERGVILRGLLATQRDALEPFELADCLLDTGGPL